MSLAMSRYDSAAGGAPRATAESAARTWGASRSASEYTATASSPSSWQARITRRAISPRLATRTREMRPSAISLQPSPAPDLRLDPEGVQRPAQRRSDVRGAAVERDGRRAPRVVLVERQPQRGEHEVLRRHAVALGLGPRHPYQGP